MFIEREIGMTLLTGLCSSQIASCEALPANWASCVLALFFGLYLGVLQSPWPSAVFSLRGIPISDRFPMFGARSAV
jgi:hypothetical protein